MSEFNPEAFNSYTRKCFMIFGAVVVGTLAMVGASFLPLGNRFINIGMVLAAACFNAFLVSAYLMHLISERKMIYTLLAFTGMFFIGLMGLTIWAAYDLPEALKY